MKSLDSMHSLLEDRFRLFFGLLLAVSVLICSMGTQAGYFYDIDETKYAAATSEMAETWDVIRPMVNGMPRIEKPPLAYWVGLPFCFAAEKLGGPDAPAPFVARFPAIFAAVMAVAGTVLLGRRLYGPAVGLAAGLMLQANVVFHFVGILDKIDIFFTACTAWLLYYLACRYMGDRERGVVAGAVGATALAVLARGPFAYIPLAGYLAAGMIREVAEQGGCAGAWAWIKGEIGFTLVVGVLGAAPFFAWIGAAYLGGVDFFGGFSDQFTHNTTVEKMSLWSRVLTTGFYADTLFFVFVPWGAYLPGALLRPRFGFRDKRTILFFCVTIAAALVFSLLFKLKSHRYILPVIPLVTVFVSAWLMRDESEDAAWDKTGRTLFELCSCWLFGIVAFFGYRFFKGGYLPVNLYDPMKLGNFMETAWPMGVAAGIAGAFAVYGMFRQRRNPFAHIACLALGFCLVAGAYYAVLPAYDPAGPGISPGVSRLAADKVEALYRPGTLVVHSRSFGRVYPGFTFFQEDFGKEQMYSLSLDLTPDLIRRISAEPADAAALFDEAYPQGEHWPAYAYFHSHAFDRTVLVLKSKEYDRFAPVLKKLPGAHVESVTGLSVKWKPETLYVVWTE